MRLLHLYMRSRRAEAAAIGLASVAAIGWVWGNIALEAPFAEASGGALVPVRLFVPLASALVIGVSTYSPWGEAEGAASKALPALRFAHLSLLLLCAALTLLVVAVDWEASYAPLVLARNLAGFAGLALLAAPVIGSRLSWALPFAHGALALLRGATSPEQFAWWAWEMQPGSDLLAAATAGVLLAMGLGSFCVLGPKESPGEAE